MRRRPKAREAATLIEADALTVVELLLRVAEIYAGTVTTRVVKIDVYFTIRPFKRTRGAKVDCSLDVFWSNACHVVRDQRRASKRTTSSSC